jgi:alginate O-acetyltransferase complex protein AlgI
VFFRAVDLPAAGRYLASMAGLGQPHDGAALLAGIVYQPYYLLTFAAAAIVTWTCPQTWDWSRTLTPAKAVAVAAAFTLSAVALTTQAFNPFIYFIF